MIETETPLAMDGFADLEQFRLPQDYSEIQAIVDHTVIPLRKPKKQHWFRVHPEIKMEGVPFLEVEQESGAPEMFMLHGKLLPSLTDVPGISRRCLRLCVSRPNNTPFVWPIKLPTDSGAKHDDWARSALATARLAETRWLRMSSDMHLNAYKHFFAAASWSEPVWPQLELVEILRRSVGENHIINSLDHPVIRQLRGLE